MPDLFSIFEKGSFEFDYQRFSLGSIPGYFGTGPTVPPSKKSASKSCCLLSCLPWATCFAQFRTRRTNRSGSQLKCDSSGSHQSNAG
jgi:hypothetical protein